MNSNDLTRFVYKLLEIFPFTLFHLWCWGRKLAFKREQLKLWNFETAFVFAIDFEVSFVSKKLMWRKNGTLCKAGKRWKNSNFILANVLRKVTFWGHFVGFSKFRMLILPHIWSSVYDLYFYHKFVVLVLKFFNFVSISVHTSLHNLFFLPNFRSSICIWHARLELLFSQRTI